MGTKQWTWRKKAGAVLTALGLTLASVGALGNPSAADHTDGSNFSTPDEGVTITPDTENCNGIIPTPGSENTEKTLTGGTLLPGGTATFQITFPFDPSADGDWEIADCVLAGSGPDLKDYVVLDHASFSGAANDQVFVLNIDFQIPEDVALGTRICNVAKTTESPSAAQGSNRKAGPACFIVGGDQTIEKHDASTGELIPDDNPATFVFTDCVTTAEDPTVQPLVISWFDTNSDPQSVVLTEDNPDLALLETTVVANRIGLNGPSGSSCDVTETVPPNGYMLPADPGPFPITITPGTATTDPFVFNDPPTTTTTSSTTTSSTTTSSTTTSSTTTTIPTTTTTVRIPPPPGPTTTTTTSTTTTTEAPLGPVVLPTIIVQETTTTVTEAPATTAAPATAPPTTARVLGVQLARTGAGSNTLLVLGGLVLVLGGMALTFGEPQVSRRRS